MAVDELLGRRREAWWWDADGGRMIGAATVGVEFEGEFKAKAAEDRFLV